MNSMTKCIKSTKNENNETLPYTAPSDIETVYYTPQEVINEIELKSIFGNPEWKQNDNGNKKKTEI